MTDEVDLEACAREPIHVPGAIQPHGVLLALGGRPLCIRGLSANASSVFDGAPAPAPGVPLEAVLGDGADQAVEQALKDADDSRGEPALFAWTVPDGRRFDAQVHRSGDAVVVELEPAVPQAVDPARTLDAFQAVHRERGLRPKAAAAVALMRRLTGYDRVMIYRFDGDWHGEVIAEARRGDLTPYLGLHFPATDIPAQARRLYERNRTRVIADRAYVPVPLVGTADAADLDLSLSTLRSVSPVHIEYLANMGVTATLTVSLVVDDGLWGLIACHHMTPRRPGSDLRSLVGWLARDLASQLALAERTRQEAHAARLAEAAEAVITRFREGSPLEQILTAGDDEILGVTGADGAAVIDGENCTTVGRTPGTTFVHQLGRHLARHPATRHGEPVFTEALARDCPGFPHRSPLAAGVIWLPLATTPPLAVAWFRGETVRHCTWGGNPDKPVVTDASGRIGPRHSFRAWRETLRGCSLPWSADERRSAERFQQRITVELAQRAEAELRILRESVAHLDEMVLITEADSLDPPGPRILFVNDRFERATGYRADEVIGRNPRFLQGPDTDRHELDRIRYHLMRWRRVRSELLNYRRDGSPFWVEITIVPVADNTGWYTHFVSIQRDITSRRQAEASLRESEQRFNELVAQLTEGVMTIDRGGRVRTVNTSACRILGRPAHELLGEPALPLLPLALEDDGPIDAEHHPAVQATNHSATGAVGEYRLLGADGEDRWLSLTSRLTDTTAGATLLLCFRDITEQRAMQSDLQRLANTDALTGLPNRASFERRLARGVAAGLRFGVLVIDLDHFKGINDALGHGMGDRLLLAVAERFRGCLDSGDVLSRLGGDEFSLCTPCVGRGDNVHALAQRLGDSLTRPIRLDGREFTLTCSTGITLYPEHGESGEELLRRADIAMYAAKRERQGGVRRFSEELEAMVRNLAATRTRLRRALDQQQFEVHYQPKVSVADGTVTGFEALLRWRQDNGELVDPDTFIPVAEDTGLIDAFGDLVLRQVVADLATLAALDMPELTIAMNLSACQFRNPDLVSDIAGAVAEADVSPSRLEVEITETVLMADNALTMAHLDGLRELGVTVAIDDFGTGYSSLAYLRRFRVGRLKIDRSFIQGMAEDAEQRTLVEAVISMADSLGLATLAEGVESAEELALLREMGCPEYQGFLFARPAPFDVVTDYLPVPGLTDTA